MYLRLFISFLFIVFFLSCQTNNERFYDVVVLSDEQSLNERVSTAEEPLVFANAVGKRSAGDFTQSVINIRQLARIQAPAELGATVSASHIHREGDFLYITYHQRGAEYAGGVDVLDLQTLSLRSFAYTEANAAEELEWNRVIATENGNTTTLTVVGDTKAGAKVVQFNANNGVVITPSVRELSLAGASGNSVVANNNQLYVSTGGTEAGGGLFEVNNANLSQGATVFSSPEMKGIASNGSDLLLALKGGNDATLYGFSLPNFTGSPQFSVSVGSITPDFGKNDISIYENTAYLALGNAGLGIFDVQRSQLTQTVGLTGTVNAAAADEDYIYVASTERLHMLDRFTNEVVSSFAYPDASANYVLPFSYDFGNGTVQLFAVANGVDGVRIYTVGVSSEVGFSNLWAPDGYRRFKTDPFSVNTPFSFRVLDDQSNEVESMGMSVPGNGMEVYYQVLEGSQLEYSFAPRGRVVTANRPLPLVPDAPVFEYPTRPELLQLNSHYDRNGRHIYSIDYFGSGTALVEVRQLFNDPAPREAFSELVLEPGRTYFIANDDEFVSIHTHLGGTGARGALIPSSSPGDDTWPGFVLRGGGDNSI